MLLFVHSFLKERSSSYTRERGIAVLLNRIMTKLTYRGKDYYQNTKSLDKDFVELTYRRNVYTNRQSEVSSSKNKIKLSYRGIAYKN